MASNTRITDLVDYTAILPYASEIFGVYQPLLGWKSKRIEERFNVGLSNDKTQILDVLKEQFSGQVEVKYGDECKLGVVSIKPGKLLVKQMRNFDSVLLKAISERLPGSNERNQAMWKELLSEGNLESALNKVVVPAYEAFYEQACKEGLKNFSRMPMMTHLAKHKEIDPSVFKQAFEKQLKYESALAGGLIHLLKNSRFTELEGIFYQTKNNEKKAVKLMKTLSADSSLDAYLNLETLDPQDKTHIESVTLSPIAVVHLFRQYFFELDTFLGTPVGHVWLSPGASAELIEVSTRKTITEKSIESELTSTTKSESSTTNEDEISDAVKEDNKTDIKFGASVSASYSSITANTSFDYQNSQQQAREETHKRMRQQTEKLSSEIRRNYKTTFKTVTEETDTSSKRYVLSNTTGNLVNYEMRRKMRQVGVQVQDIGTYLCWQTYVDDPGKDLGISKLVHIAKSPDLDSLPHPEEIPTFQDFEEKGRVITIPFISAEDTGADNEDEVYENGVEVDDTEFMGNLEKIKYQFDFSFVCSKANYVLKNVEFDSQGKPIKLSLSSAISNSGDRATINVNVDSVDFQGKNSIDVGINLYWSPAAGANDDIVKKNKENIAKFTAKEKELFEKTYTDNARERIKLSSKIQSRKSEDLRQEEQIVVYRRLIQDMLSNGIAMPDDRTRHVVAELINSIFDVDKMLYFVAPEWWRPRLHHSHQQLELTKPANSKPLKSIIKATAGMLGLVTGGVVGNLIEKETVSNDAPDLTSSVVGWGGMQEENRDNYYITEDSDPAKLGSSLGWLLQLDGDNLRNAFLNAPWVKAVIPIRPGREKAAINWLKGVEGMNGIGPQDVYHASNPEEVDIDGNPLEGQPFIDVLMDLAKKIELKHKEGIEKGKYPKQDDIANPELVDESNTVTSTPIDRVYEHGFYALKDGFRANVAGNYEIFDQWIEVLPTDQVVPVEVNYNPKTGRQI